MAIDPKPANDVGPMPDLTGVVLNDRWVVVSRDQKKPGESGRNFCACYLVAEKGKADASYFMKALDFYRPLQNSSNVVADLLPLLQQFDFEERVLAKCQDTNRVVTAIDSGQYMPPSERIPIPFLIFELGTGDMRRKLAAAAVDFTWKLRAFHNIAAAVQAIHRRDLAHQDIKPSNVVVFPGLTKVADLGRASWKGVDGPHDHHAFPGDPAYMPPEFRYGWTHPSFERRRLGTDVYMLGAIGVFLFTGLHLNAIVDKHLSAEFKPPQWTRSFEDVLGYYREAFYRALDDVERALPDDGVGRALVHIIKWLCEPDPMKRGFVRMGKIEPTQYSLDRLVAELDYLTGKAEIAKRSQKKQTHD